jgi:hypothetical protein
MLSALKNDLKFKFNKINKNKEKLLRLLLLLRFWFSSKVYIIGASKPDLNLFLSNNTNKLTKILEKGIIINNNKIKLKIIGTIQDTLEIPRIYNCKQYNGKYGCLHCLHPGKRLLNPRKQVYEYSIKHKVRTPSDYENQVRKAIETGNIFKGIRGNCWISQFFKIPDGVVLDYMHVSCIGTVETTLKIWLKDLSK